MLVTLRDVTGSLGDRYQPTMRKIELTVTLAFLLAEHVRWMRARGLAATTIYQRQRAIHRLEAAGVDPITATPDQLMGWALSLTMGLEARATEISHVRQWFTWLADTGRRPVNVAEHIDRPKLPDALPRPMSDTDLTQAIVTATAEVGTWLTLAGYAGLRCCEIAPLRRDDIHTDGDVWRIQVRGKGGRERIVPASSVVRARLRTWGLDGRWLFPRRDGRPGPRPAHAVSQIGNVHLHSLGINATMHSARHRMATRLLEETGNIALVQRVLGHRSMRTTQRYVGWADLDAATALELIVPDLELVA